MKKKVICNTIEDLPESIKHKMEFLLSEHIILKRFIEVKDIRSLSKRIKVIADSGELSRIENCYSLKDKIDKLEYSYLNDGMKSLRMIRSKLLGLDKPKEEEEMVWKVLPRAGKVFN